MALHGDKSTLVHVCITLLAVWACVVCLWALVRGDLPASHRGLRALLAPGFVLAAACVGAVAGSWS